MLNSTNAKLFDRFRHVGRKMRMGRAPGMMTPDVEQMRALMAGGKGMPPMPAFHREVILVVLYKNGSGMKQQDIADELHISKSTLSEMINKLAEDGCLERTADPSDRRATIIVLTEKGRKRAEEVIEERAGMMDFMFRNLTEDEKEELIRLLDKLLGDESRDCI